MSQVLLVIEVDAHNGRDQRRGDIGRIQPPAESDLENGNLDPAFTEVKKSNCGEDLEMVGVIFDDAASLESGCGFLHLENP